MILDPMFMIFQKIRLFLTAVLTTVVTPFAIILAVFNLIYLNLTEFN